MSGAIVTRTAAAGDLISFLEEEVFPALTVEVLLPNTQFAGKGDELRGDCCRHKSESKQSLHINRRTLEWYCFGCRQGGGPIQLWWFRKGNTGTPKGLDYVETARELAALVGKELPERELTDEQRAKAQAREQRRAIVGALYRHGQAALWAPEGEAALAFLHQRGFTDPQIQDLGLGFYLSDVEMGRALRAEGYSQADIKAARVLQRNLSGYILFRILDLQGRPWSAYGRYVGTPPDKEMPKTIGLRDDGGGREGPKEYPLFLDRAKRAGHRLVVVVEGLIDGALAQGLGESNVVTTAGSQLTEAQARALRRAGIREVALCGDPDDAGDKGTCQGARNAEAAGLVAYVLPRLPENTDPDEFILTNGVEAWRALVEQREHAYRHEAREIVRQHRSNCVWTDAGQVAARKAALDLAALKGAEKADDLAEYFFGELRKEGLTVTPPALSSNGKHPTPVLTVVDGGAHKKQTLADVRRLFRKWFYLGPEGREDDGHVCVALAAAAANYMPGVAVWLMLVGGSGSGKTETILSLGLCPHVHTAATLTEAALLSGTPKRDKAGDATGGILRKVGDFGLLLLKDFTSILSMEREARTRTLGALREIHDGSWSRDIGADGGRKLEWKGKLGIITGCTGAIDSHHSVNGMMGERFIEYRLPQADDQEQALKALEHYGREEEMRQELAAAVGELFTSLDFTAPSPALSSEEKTRLAQLASLAARSRSGIERDPHNREIILVPTPEAPGRLTRILARLFAGLLVIGVERDEAWQLIVKTGMDSLPSLRWRALQFCADEGKPVNTTTIGAAVRHPTQTTRRALEDLAAHGVLNRIVAEKNGNAHPAEKNGNAHLWELSAWAKVRYEAILPYLSRNVGEGDTEGARGDPLPLPPADNPSDDFSGTLPGMGDRASSCWQCKQPVSTETDDTCGACGWIRCPGCGACEAGCGGDGQQPGRTWGRVRASA